MKDYHDILTRKRTIIGEDGKLQEVDNLPNNRLVDNQFALMVDQKTNYLVGKPFSLTCKNKTYSEFLNKVFDKRFKRLLKYVCEDALKGGIGWLYPYYGDDSKLAFKHFPAHDILPFWADDDHTILDCAVRLLHHKRFGTVSARKLWSRWKSSNQMAFTAMCIKMDITLTAGMNSWGSMKTISVVEQWRKKPS